MNKKQLIWISIIAFSCILIYTIPNAIYYCRFHENGLSLKVDAWGQYGDFIGGSLNPILAIVNIVALIYLSFTVSDVEDKRAKESIIAQKNIAYTQLRYHTITEFSSSLILIFDEKYQDKAKAYRMLLIRTHLFKQSSEFLFADLYDETFQKECFSPLIKSINDLIEFFETKDIITNLHLIEELNSVLASAQAKLVNRLNEFTIERS